MGGYYHGWFIYQVVVFVLGCFIFSLIFWLTYVKVVEPAKQLLKKKK